MHVDFMSKIAASPLEAEAAGVVAEAAGYDGFGVPETKHDAFTTLTLAARATSTIDLQSAIAVAFARNPMTVAYCANDLQLIGVTELPDRIDEGTRVIVDGKVLEGVAKGQYTRFVIDVVSVLPLKDKR